MHSDTDSSHLSEPVEGTCLQTGASQTLAHIPPKATLPPPTSSIQFIFFKQAGYQAIVTVAHSIFFFLLTMLKHFLISLNILQSILCS